MHGMREPGMYKIQELDYWLLKTSNGRLSCIHPLNEILAKTKMRRQRCEGSMYSICSRWSSSRMRWIYKWEFGADNGKPPLQSALLNMIGHRSFSFPAKAYDFFIKTKEIINNININIKYWLLNKYPYSSSTKIKSFEFTNSSFIV